MPGTLDRKRTESRVRTDAGRFHTQGRGNAQPDGGVSAHAGVDLERALALPFRSVSTCMRMAAHCGLALVAKCLRKMPLALSERMGFPRSSRRMLVHPVNSNDRNKGQHRPHSPLSLGLMVAGSPPAERAASHFGLGFGGPVQCLQNVSSMLQNSGGRALSFVEKGEFNPSQGFLEVAFAIERPGIGVFESWRPPERGPRRGPPCLPLDRFWHPAMPNSRRSC